MPCNDWGSGPPGRTEYVDNPEVKRRLDRVTRILCGVMHHLSPEQIDQLTSEVDGLDDWWTKHQEDDRRREEAERRAEAKKRRALLNAREARSEKYRIFPAGTIVCVPRIEELDNHWVIKDVSLGGDDRAPSYTLIPLNKDEGDITRTLIHRSVIIVHSATPESIARIIQEP